jgi:hypothetical protein
LERRLQMTFAELGAIGEFIGSIAVLATLIYLATQIRQNNRSMEDNKKFALAQVYQSRAALTMQLQNHWDPETIAKVSLYGDDNKLGLDPMKVDQLTEAERLRLTPFLFGNLTILDNVCYQYELGLLPDDVRSGAVGFTLQTAYSTMQKLGVPITPRVRRAIDEYQLSRDPSWIDEWRGSHG